MTSEDDHLKDESPQQIVTPSKEEKECKIGTEMMITASLLMVTSIWLLNDYVSSTNVKLLVGIPIFIVGLLVIYFGYKKTKSKEKSQSNEKADK